MTGLTDVTGVRVTVTGPATPEEVAALLTVLRSAGAPEEPEHVPAPHPRAGEAAQQCRVPEGIDRAGGVGVVHRGISVLCVVGLPGVGLSVVGLSWTR